jgi:hypothetical protein
MAHCHHVKRIGHLASMVKMRVKPGAVALVQVAGDSRDAGQEGLVFG